MLAIAAVLLRNLTGSCRRRRGGSGGRSGGLGAGAGASRAVGARHDWPTVGARHSEPARQVPGKGAAEDALDTIREARLGLGRIVALYYCSSTSYQIH